MEDNVATIGVHGVSNSLALCCVREGLCILCRNLNVGALLLVCISNTAAVTILKLVDKCGRNAANKANLASLCGASSNVANNKGRLLSAEHNAREVRNLRIVAVVDDSKLGVWIVLSSLKSCVCHSKANAPNKVGLSVNSLIKVGCVIGILLGLKVADIPAVLVLELGHALPSGLVKGLVVNTTSIGNHGELLFLLT